MLITSLLKLLTAADARGFDIAALHIDAAIISLGGPGTSPAVK